jgi:RNA polymerase sigma factor (sigma-70 family)
MVRFSMRSPLSDGELLARFQQERDRDAFSEIITRHGPLVWRYCARQLHATDADDAFQAVFLVLALKVESIRNHDALASWLLGTARRVIRQSRRRKSFQSLTTEVAGPQREPVEFWLDDELARLPEKLRDVVVLCLVQERTQLDAAEKLGISERTLRRRLDEGKTRLRSQLTRRGLAPAVILAMLANLNSSPAAIPGKLGEAALDTTLHYLIGLSPMTAPAILATGVMMTATKKLVTVTLLTLALGTTLVGIGSTQAPPTAEKPTAKVEPAKPVQPPEPPKLKGPWRAPFHVECQIPYIKRAIQNELQFQYQVQSEIVTGGTILEGEEAICEVVYSNQEPVGSLGTGFVEILTAFGVSTDIRPQEPGEKPSVRKVKFIKLRPRFERVLQDGLPSIAHRHLLAKYVDQDRQLPDWVELALIGFQYDYNEEKTLIKPATEALLAGEAYRLKSLFSPIKKIDEGQFQQIHQSSIVWLFLHSIHIQPNPELELKVRVDGPKIVTMKYKDIPKSTPLTASAGCTDRRPSMAAAEFIRLGMAKEAGWDVAAKTVYGFADLEVMEKAWIEWVMKLNAKPADKVDGDRIPAMRKP